jgi:hypothetical protein
MHKILHNPAGRISARFVVFGLKQLPLSRIKAAPPIIPSETIRSRAG